LREQWQKVEGYFQNNLHRMEYPEYQAEGWQIGSGVVESACKTVVGQRLKGAGMRWSEVGAHALCHVRALYRSEKGQWESFWRGDLRKTKVYQLNFRLHVLRSTPRCPSGYSVGSLLAASWRSAKTKGMMLRAFHQPKQIGKSHRHCRSQALVLFGILIGAVIHSLDW
jgi:hypothetical protein